MAGQKRQTSKAFKKVIRSEVKRAKLSQSELHRRAWSISTYQLSEPTAGLVPLVNASGGVNYILNSTLQGTSSDQRVGNQIKETGLRIKGMIMQSSTTPIDVCSCVRVIVVRDHDNKGLTPGISEILEFPAGDPAIGSLVSWSNRKRFSFLLDQVFPLQAQSSTASSAVACAPVDIDLRGDAGLSNTLTYSASSDSAASLQNGGIYCFMFYCHMGANPSGPNSPMFAGTVTFFFHDI